MFIGPVFMAIKVAIGVAVFLISWFALQRQHQLVKESKLIVGSVFGVIGAMLLVLSIPAAVGYVLTPALLWAVRGKAQSFSTAVSKRFRSQLTLEALRQLFRSRED